MLLLAAFARERVHFLAVADAKHDLAEDMPLLQALVSLGGLLEGISGGDWNFQLRRVYGLIQTLELMHTGDRTITSEVDAAAPFRNRLDAVRIGYASAFADGSDTAIQKWAPPEAE